MESIIVLTLFGLALFTILYILRQYWTGKAELISIRNVFLAGFVIFQLTSAAVPLLTRNTQGYRFTDFNRVAMWYVPWVATYLFVFLFTYERGWFVKKIAQKVPKPKIEPSTVICLGLIALLLIVGSAFRFVQIPLIGIITNQVGLGFLAVAAGISTWIWARQPYNPAWIALAMFVVAYAALMSLVGEFGRRPLVAVGAASLWGAYFSAWRYLSPKWVLPRMAVLAVPAILALAAFSTVRGMNREGGTSLRSVVKVMNSADVGRGLLVLLDGQGTGFKSMWLMENYPDKYDYTHFGMLNYLVVYPIPREWWPQKPEPLSTIIASQADLDGVNQDKLTIGPGIVGHAAVDGGYYMVIIYAVFMGLLIRFFDEMVRTNPWKMLIVLPMGCSLGQVLGFARGETSIFMGIFIISTVGCYLAILAISSLLPKTAGMGEEPETYEDDAYPEGDHQLAAAGHHDAYESYGDYEDYGDYE